MSVWRRLMRRTADYDTMRDLCTELKTRSADEVMTYIDLVTELDPYDVMEMAVNSLCEDNDYVRKLKALYALFGVECYDMTDPAEAAQAVKAVAANNDMTIEEATEYIDKVFPAPDDCLVYDKPRGYSQHFNFNGNWWDQVRVFAPFTHDDAAEAVRIVYDDTTDGWSQGSFIEQLVEMTEGDE